MPKQHKLDVDFGADLLAQISAEAEATGLARAEVARTLVREALIARGELRMRIHLAVVALGATVEPDGQYDPAEDDPRQAAALTQLAQLLGDTAVAEGIMDALGELWARWVMPDETRP